MLHKIQLCILYKWQEMVRLRQTTKHLVQLQQWCSHQNPPQWLQYSWQFPEFDQWSCYGIQIRCSLAGQSPIHTGDRRICIHRGTGGSKLVQHGGAHSKPVTAHGVVKHCIRMCAVLSFYTKDKVDHTSVHSSPVQSSPPILPTHPQSSFLGCLQVVSSQLAQMIYVWADLYGRYVGG